MGHKVLLADDSITVQKIVKLSLTEEGIEVIALGNGEQAVQQLATLQPDLVMADVFMPGKDGYEVCEYVKSHPQFKHTPVILLVHAFEPFDPERAKKVGADQQLTKPFQSIRMLVTTVRDLLARSQSSVVTTAEATASAEFGSDSLTPLSPTISSQPEEEFAVVSSLSVTASAMAEPESSGTHSPAFSMASPFPDSFQPLAPTNLLVPPVSSPISAEAATPDFLPPLELSMPPPSDRQFASVASAETAAPEFDVATFSSVALAATPAAPDAMSEAAADVLDLSDVLSLPQERVSSSLGFSAPALPPHEVSLLAPLPSMAALSTLSEEELAPVAPARLDEATFAKTFDVGIGQFSLDAPLSMLPVPVPAPTTQGQDVSAGVEVMPSVNATLPLSEAVIEEVVNRVMQRLSAQTIQEIAWEVVPEMAELMIRKQLSQHLQLSR